MLDDQTYVPACLLTRRATPISGKYANPFNNWGATLIDALDTLWLMGMVPEFEDAVKQVEKIDFTTSRRADIPLFETTIRYMGGLLGGYEISSRHYQPLLDQAAKLGEKSEQSEEKSQQRDTRGGRGGFRGGRGGRFANNVKFDPSQQKVTDDPVEIRKQVRTARRESMPEAPCS